MMHNMSLRMNLCYCGNLMAIYVYLMQVDTSAANSTSEGLMWLRLVQSARDKEEQNLEAYVKNGQLFYRSLRRIEKDEELLVWYGKDLIDLLLLSSSRAPAKSKGDMAAHFLELDSQYGFYKSGMYQGAPRTFAWLIFGHVRNNI